MAGPAVPLAEASPLIGGLGETGSVLLALAAVILLGQVLGALLRRVGQPPVIGEILAGILLGPSLLGQQLSTWVLPAVAALPVVAGTLAYLALMALAVRPMMACLVRRWVGGNMPAAALPVLMAGALLSALATEWIGIHALFGAFVFGVVVPADSKLARGLVELIALNVGLQLELISPTLFAMLVLMALATTLATAPILGRLGLGVAGPNVGGA